MCVDRGLEKVVDKSEMITNGWLMCIEMGFGPGIFSSVAKAQRHNRRQENLCKEKGLTGFWGYHYGCPIGGVSAQFEGSGTATLNFGSCYYSIVRGQTASTKVFLNEKLIKTAVLTTPAIIVSEEVTFEYNRGDVLKIEEWGTYTVTINSLKLTKCKGMVDLRLLVLITTVFLAQLYYEKIYDYTNIIFYCSLSKQHNVNYT